MTIKQKGERKGKPKPAPPNNPNPDKDSNRSRKRRNRGFKSLELSSRKHKRAERRLAISQTVDRARHPAGLAVEWDGSTYHSGGANKYHAT